MSQDSELNRLFSEHECDLRSRSPNTQDIIDDDVDTNICPDPIVVHSSVSFQIEPIRGNFYDQRQAKIQDINDSDDDQIIHSVNVQTSPSQKPSSSSSMPVLDDECEHDDTLQVSMIVQTLETPTKISEWANEPNVEPKPTFVAPTFSPLPLSTPAGPSRKREQHRLSDLRFLKVVSPPQQKKSTEEQQSILNSDRKKGELSAGTTLATAWGIDLIQFDEDPCICALVQHGSNLPKNFKHFYKMTFFHFCNCAVLAYAPYIIAYKYSVLSEYSSYWKCAQAAIVYLCTQFIKMMALATFFPAIELDGFNLLLQKIPFGIDLDKLEELLKWSTLIRECKMEILKNSVDVIDLLGIHFAMSNFISGRSEVRSMTIGVGWAAAHSLLTYFFVLFVGARTTGFSWRYIQTSMEANIDLIFYLSLASLVWLFNRNDLPALFKRIVEILLIFCVFRSVIYQVLYHLLALRSWTLLAAKALCIFTLALSTFFVYSTGMSIGQQSTHQKTN